MVKTYSSSLLAASILLTHTLLYGQAPLRLIDLDGEVQRQIVVDREPGRYLGHPSTVLLEDGKTIIVVYPQGHGRGPILLKRSTDGGLTWSGRLPVPENWSTSLETPTIYRTIDREGKKILILFSGLNPARIAISEDDGRSWSPLRAIDEWGGIVVMSSVERLHDGRYLAMFHDDGRYIRPGGRLSSTMTLYKSFSMDGGRTWSSPEAIFSGDTIHLCEPGVVRSPDGRQLAALVRENTRTHNSFVLFSDDEGATWSAPRELPPALTGDRHTARYAPDGRLLVSFRDMAANSPTRGDWVAWVGTYEDLVAGREGQFRVRLKDNLKGSDCGYPGVEVLPDGMFVLTTYGHWVEGEEPFILCVRLRLSDLER
jgi:BNR repeat-like domain